MNLVVINILSNASCFSFALPLAAGVFYIKRLDGPMRLLVLLMIAVGITEVSSFFLIEFLKTQYYWIHHLYSPIEYTLFALIFSRWINHRLYSKLVIYSIPAFIILSISNTLFLQGLNQLNSYTITLMFIIYTIITLYVLHQIMADDIGNILKNHIFWVSTGLLIFSTGDLAYFAFHPLVEEHYLVVIWAIHTIFNMTTYIFYFVGIICQGKNWE